MPRPDPRADSGAQDTTLEAPGLVAVKPSHQMTDVAQTRLCRLLPLGSTRDIAQPLQPMHYSGSATLSASFRSASGSDTHSSTRRMKREWQWRGDGHLPRVGPGIERTDLVSISVWGQPVERVALLCRLGQPSPTQRALVLETRARMVGAAGLSTPPEWNLWLICRVGESELHNER